LGDKISVIIPTYKRPFDMLLRAIESVINQTYSNIELIIVDDSPASYKNREYIKSKIESLTDNRIRYIAHEYNQGACEARNTGIRNAKGKYIAFLDDDDEWLPQKLEKQYEKIRSGNFGLVYCFSYTIKHNMNGQYKKKYSRKNIAISGWVYDDLILNNFIGSTSFVLVSKEALNKCGYFDTRMKSAQDCELWLRISRKYQVDVVEEPLVNYHIHKGERISTNLDNKIQGLEMLNDINMFYLSSNPKALSTRKLVIIPYYKKKYGFLVAMKKWLEAVKIYPFNRLYLKYLIKIIF